MTVILSIHDGQNPVSFISDVLVSVEGDVDRSIILPHMTHASKLQFGTYTLAGLSQKTVIFGNTLVMWAGRRTTALSIIQEVFSRSNGGSEYVPLSHAIASLNLLKSEIEDVAILTAFCDAPNNIVTCAHDVTTYDVRLGPVNGRISAAGSGSFDFLENYNATPALPKDYSLMVDVIQRLSIRTAEPFLKIEEQFHYLYGGWFEFARHRDLSFEKLPIALKFWSRPTGESRYNEDGPLIFSQYIENDLFLTTVGYNQHGQGSSVLRVPDLLRRGNVIDNWTEHDLSLALKFAPELFIHVLVEPTQAKNGLNIRVCPYFVNGDALVNVEFAVGADKTMTASAKLSSKLIEYINRQRDAAAWTSEGPRQF